MELKEFVKTAISDITSAVKELQDELDNGAIVSPSMPNAISNTTVIDPQNININRLISKIDFDVTITVGNKDKADGGLKAGIHVFSAKIGAGKEEHTENASRITFSIPIVLPMSHVKNKKEIKGQNHKDFISGIGNQDISVP